jgi:anti-anti-sigma factor
MDSRQFEVKVSEVEGELLVELIGWMDIVTSAKFRAAMTKATHGTGANVVLDCARLVYIDSSAMGSILFWRERLAEDQRSIAFANCRGDVLQAMKLGGFPRIFTFR